MIYNREQAERLSQSIGHHFFCGDTLRFFMSRIGKFYPVPGGAFFVTSERRNYNRPRRYTVRFIGDTGKVQTRGGYLDGFQRFATRTGANHYAAECQRVAKMLSKEDQ